MILITGPEGIRPLWLNLFARFGPGTLCDTCGEPARWIPETDDGPWPECDYHAGRWLRAGYRVLPIPGTGAEDVGAIAPIKERSS